MELLALLAARAAEDPAWRLVLQQYLDGLSQFPGWIGENVRSHLTSSIEVLDSA